ncbi:MAG: hypothetical protein JOS17DRAFT_250362 [Linnemannia elongata]|nr:MAG: hypothetical protein JOS17DRAFT_250362 [Linnemannia elongata]
MTRIWPLFPFPSLFPSVVVDTQTDRPTRLRREGSLLQATFHDTHSRRCTYPPLTVFLSFFFPVFFFFPFLILPSHLSSRRSVQNKRKRREKVYRTLHISLFLYIFFCFIGLE